MRYFCTLMEIPKTSSRILWYIYRHKRLAKTYDWLSEHWLMLVIFVLFVAVVLCMINLAVMVFVQGYGL